MEASTAYSYLINSIDRLKFYDITAISTDFILRLSTKQREFLYEEIRTSKFSKSFEKTPQTEAQFHAFIHENALKTRRAIFDLLNEEEDLFCFPDIAIVDYDCGVGLHSLSFIDYLKSFNHDYSIKEIVLIDENQFCLERAELLVKSLIPDAVVKTVNKKGNSVSINEIRLEHTIVYNLACSGNHNLNRSVVNNAFEGGRYLFAKLVEKSGTFSSGLYSKPPYTSSFYIKSDYSISERIDFDSVRIPIIKDKEGSRYIFHLFKSSDVYGELNKEDDEYIQKIESILANKEPSPFSCYQTSRNASDSCVLAKLNLIVCLIWGIGCHTDKKEAKSLLLEMNGKYDEKINRIVIGLLCRCGEDEDERRGYLSTYLSLNIPESKKCGRRCDLASILWDIDKEQSEKLYRICIENGCDNCSEASNYDINARHCPRAQYWLSQLVEEKSPDESLQLLKESAEQGFKSALNPLGCYYFNECKGEERKKATELFIRAANMGVDVAARNAYLSLKDSDTTKALWYIALACKNNDQRAKDEIIDLLPKVVFGKRGDQLVDEQVIKNAEDGLSQYKERAIDILINRIKECQKQEWYEDATKELNRLESLDPELAKQKRDEVEEIDHDLPYQQNDMNQDDYSIEDSIRDALDDQPDAYWNID